MRKLCFAAQGSWGHNGVPKYNLGQKESFVGAAREPPLRLQLGSKLPAWRHGRKEKPVTDHQIDVRRHIAIACYLLVGCYLLLALYLLSGLTGPGRYYRSGVPAGADFVQIWAASSLATQGQAALVYDAAELSQVEHCRRSAASPPAVCPGTIRPPSYG